MILDKTMMPSERLAANTSPCPITGCHYWMGSVCGGYGRITLFGEKVQAHRLAWELKKGPIPEGMVLDHLCKNQLCVNVDHLEVVTQRVNVHRSNGIAALNARKTHCKHGHPFDEKNTYRYGETHRACRKCCRIRSIKKRSAAILGEKENN